MSEQIELFRILTFFTLTFKFKINCGRDLKNIRKFLNIYIIT